MSPDIPPAPPEADVILLARNAAGMTALSAAEATKKHDAKGVSVTYWRDVERGQGGRRGERVPVRASDRALAAMARVVGVVPQQLADVGRSGAARVLEEIQRREDRTAIPRPVTVILNIADGGSLHDLMDRIWTDDLERFIAATATMTEAERRESIEELRAKRAELRADLRATRNENDLGIGLARSPRLI